MYTSRVSLNSSNLTTIITSNLFYDIVVTSIQILGSIKAGVGVGGFLKSPNDLFFIWLVSFLIIVSKHLLYHQAKLVDL